jgi:hypothetical protein
MSSATLDYLDEVLKEKPVQRERYITARLSLAGPRARDDVIRTGKHRDGAFVWRKSLVDVEWNPGAVRRLGHTKAVLGRLAQR